MLEALMQEPGAMPVGKDITPWRALAILDGGDEVDRVGAMVYTLHTEVPAPGKRKVHGIVRATSEHVDVVRFLTARQARAAWSKHIAKGDG